MSSNICGNCANFKPRQGERFFNCTSAVQAGVKYGMQVRADTRACDAFVPIKASPAPQPPPKKTATPKKDRQRPLGLCPWGRLIIIVAIVIAILLLSFLGYTCAKNLTSPAPTPEPTAIPQTPTPIPTRPSTPTPVPTPVAVIYFELGQFSTNPVIRATVANPVQANSYRNYLGGTVDAPVGTVFVICDSTLLNEPFTLRIITPEYFSLVNALGLRYYPGAYAVTDALSRSEIRAGGAASGKILFVVPQSDWGLEVRAGNAPGQEAAWKLPW